MTLSVSLIVGCIGDPGYSVTVENQTGTTVTFFVEDVNARPGSAMAEGTTLSPGADDVNHWLIPEGSRDPRRAKVRAVTTSGEQLYCHRVGWDELKQLRFHLELKSGVSDCS
jgi:hypothetical protein